MPRQIRYFALGVVCAFSVSCASMHGPDYKTPGGYKTSSDYKNPADPRSEDSSVDDYQHLPAVGGLSWRGARRTTKPQSEVNFDWPVDAARLTQGFNLGKRPHWGIDLAAKRGTPVLASESGVVVYTGHGFHGYGNLVVIEHNSEWATLYSHLDKITAHEGDSVHQGEAIGQMGRTGRATGVHLHFEIRQNRQPVNPLALLPEGLGPIVPGPHGGASSGIEISPKVDSNTETNDEPME